MFASCVKAPQLPGLTARLWKCLLLVPAVLSPSVFCVSAGKGAGMS